MESSADVGFVRDGVSECPLGRWTHDRIIFELWETLSGPAPTLEYLLDRLT